MFRANSRAACLAIVIGLALGGCISSEQSRGMASPDERPLREGTDRTDIGKPLLPPPNHGGVYVVAHRGVHVGIPENTLAAYRKAIELGCDFVEVDIRMTKDGRFVSVHNKEIDRYVVDGTTGLVSEMTLVDLRALDIGSRIGPEWSEERIPTFDEILDLCKGRCGIYLDLKDAPVAPLVRMIRERGMERRVLWYADNDELDEVVRLLPEGVIMPDPGAIDGLSSLLQHFSPSVVAAVWRHFSADFVQLCHDANAIVIVDEGGPDCWEEALRWGTDGIQTDHPESLIAFLDAGQAGK